MTINPPDSWWVLHPPNEFQRHINDFGIAPDMKPTLTFASASSTGFRVMVGAIGGGMNAQSTLVFDDTSGVTSWECLLGWAGIPTKAVSLGLPNESIGKQFLTTDGDAYVTCGTAFPTYKPKTTSSSVAGIDSSTDAPSASSPAASPAPSSYFPASTSASPTGHVAGASPYQHSPSPSSVGSLSAIASLFGVSEPSSTVQNHANASGSLVGGMDDTYEGQLWLKIPDPQVSVHPLDPRVGDWDAVGPFEHLFSFHAWVPTYLEEAFDIYTQKDGNWTSVTQCTIGISTRPAGTEVVTYTVTKSAGYIVPSGDVNGASAKC